MIYKFSNLTLEQKKHLCNAVYFECVNRKGEFEVEFRAISKKRTNKQNAGYFRLCSLLVPFFQKEYGEIFDKELVSETVKLSANYSIKVGKQVSPKSLKRATIEDMSILIKKLYEICDYFKLKNYQLTDDEELAMFEYYSKKDI
jgi:hypothetical protein